VTQMVGEFPELQGIVGRHYALRAGEDPAVARAIEEHYWPTQAGGPLPSSAEADAVSMGDKLDTIVGCFGVGLLPTGTADPYGLRRQTLGVLRILLEKGYRLQLSWLIEEALQALGSKLTRPAAEVQADVLAFFKGRLENLLTQGGFQVDLVTAALEAGFEDVVDARARLEALTAARVSGILAPLTESFRRVANILKGAGSVGGPVDPALLVESAEKDLWRAFEEVREAMEAAARLGEYAVLLREAGKLKAVVDAFFESVLVMAEDPAVRGNRLALLSEVAGTLRRVADFTRVASS
jgi:glycyl-tRNA synthetase beta chain